MTIPTAIAHKLSKLGHKYLKDVWSDLDRSADRGLLDQARDRELCQLAAAVAEHATIARPLNGVVPDDLSTAQAMAKVNVHQTTWTDLVKSGLITPIDPSAGIHRFFKGDVERLRDMPSAARREHVRQWKAKKHSALAVV